jgi:hypothetical protein
MSWWWWIVPVAVAWIVTALAVAVAFFHGAAGRDRCR